MSEYEWKLLFLSGIDFAGGSNNRRGPKNNWIKKAKEEIGGK